MDPATFLASNSVLGPYFPLKNSLFYQSWKRSKCINSCCAFFFSLCCLLLPAFTPFFFNTAFRYTELARVVPVDPVHLPLTHKIHSSLNHKTCTTIRDPQPSHYLHHKTKENQSSHQKTTAKELHIQVPICHMAPRASVPQEH